MNSRAKSRFVRFLLLLPVCSVLIAALCVLWLKHSLNQIDVGPGVGKALTKIAELIKPAHSEPVFESYASPNGAFSAFAYCRRYSKTDVRLDRIEIRSHSGELLASRDFVKAGESLMQLESSAWDKNSKYFQFAIKNKNALPGDVVEYTYVAASKSIELKNR